MPMDWGTLIPFWYLAGQDSKTKVVVVAPSREIPLESLARFGQTIAETAKTPRRRIAFVASATKGMHTAQTAPTVSIQPPKNTTT